MSNIALEPRTRGPAHVSRPAPKAVDSARASSPRTACAPPRDFEESPWQSAVDFVRMMAGMIVLYTVMFAMPLMILLPFVAVGLLLGMIGLLFGGMA
jgi:hypothetical protein